MPVYINYGFIKGVSREWRWGIVIIYLLAIYSFLPFAPGFWRYVLGQWGNSVDYLGFFLTSLIGTYFLLHLIFQRQVRKISVYAAFCLISMVCLAILKYLCITGAERFHLLMYGVLSCFVFWALKLNVKGKRVYLYTTIIAFIFGVLDEVIQGILPMRVFDIKDILMNWLSSGMGTLFIIFVLEPEIL